MIVGTHLLHVEMDSAAELMHQRNNVLMSAVAQPFNICPERCIRGPAMTVMMIVIIIGSCFALAS